MILPKIDNGRNHEKLQKRQRRSHGKISTRSTYDPTQPLTLELKHGGQLHKVRLPTENLDKSKKYYVTFTIDKAANNGIIEESSFDENEEHHVIPHVESR